MEPQETSSSEHEQNGRPKMVSVLSALLHHPKKSKWHGMVNKPFTICPWQTSPVSFPQKTLFSILSFPNFLYPSSSLTSDILSFYSLFITESQVHKARPWSSKLVLSENEGRHGGRCGRSQFHSCVPVASLRSWGNHLPWLVRCSSFTFGVNIWCRQPHFLSETLFGF